MLRVLCLEDSPQDVEIMRELLVDSGYDLKMACTEIEKEFVSLLHRGSYDIILADFKLPGFDAFAALRWAMEICPKVPFICVSGSIGEEAAVELLKQGAVDYVIKDRLARLPAAIKRALDEAKEKDARRQVEEKLRESEIELHAILESTADGILAVDKKGKTIKTNKRFTDLWRIPQTLLDSGDDEALLTFVSDQLIEPEQFLKKVHQLYGSIDEDVDTLFFKDGRIFERFSIPLLLNDSNIGRVWSFRDITERKRAEEVLKESEQRFKGIFDKARDGMILADAESRMFYMINSSMSEMLGYQPDEINKMKVDDIHPKETLPYVLEQFTKLSTKKISIAENIPVKKKDGSIFYTDITVSFIEIGNHNYIVGFFRDITERKRTEEVLQEAAKERERLIKELHYALDNIKTLQGLIPICASCKKIRDDKGFWNQVEKYIGEHTDAEFTHGICPECAKQLYGDLYEKALKKHE